MSVNETIAATLAASLVLVGCSSTLSPAEQATSEALAAEQERTSQQAEPTSATATVTAEAPDGAPVEPTATGEQDADVNNEFVEEVLASGAMVLAQPQDAAELEQVFEGSALEEAQALRAQYANEGYRQEGEPKIISSTLLADESDETTKVIEACVDNSEVRTLDENGEQLNADLSEEDARSKMILTFVESDGVWKLANTSFPNNPKC